MTSLVFLASFIPAFLLFAVEPMATKMVLPVLGGTPAVWNTAMLTFQIFLLAGYGYAHLVSTRLEHRTQIKLHTALALVTCLLLPLMVSLPAGEAVLEHPIYYLLRAFTFHLGLPFMMLAATAPLLQSWVSRSSHPLAKTPYVLYSASNLGSFLALLGYVALLEPLSTLNTQRWGWSLLYVLAAGLILYTGHLLPPKKALKKKTAVHAKADWKRRALWIWLAFLPSSLMLSVTSYITTDIASVPLLWVIPLAIYLLAFVDAFRDRPLVATQLMRIAPLIGVGSIILYGMHLYLAEVLLIELLFFAVLTFTTNGWLAQSKPDADALTGFYFCLAVGGALGGVFNAIAAPLLFSDTYEYPLTLLAASITGFILWQRRHGDGALNVRQHLLRLGRVMAQVAGFTGVVYLVLLRFQHLLPDVSNTVSMNGLHLSGQLIVRAASLGAFMALAIQRRFIDAFYACVSVVVITMFAADHGIGQPLVFKARNFFGVEQVFQNDTYRTMMHNTTMHGMIPVDPKAKLEPITYYYALHDVFDVLSVTHRYPLAVIGLGTGNTKCYARAGQRTDLFEINPMVVMLAEDPAYFRYLRDCPGEHRVLLGDGRVMFALQDAQYGAIVLDAFSSDAIPVHLITREALELYLSKLAPHGVLLVHISNRHLDLEPLLAAQAQALGLTGYAKVFQPPAGRGDVSPSNWVMLAKGQGDLAPILAAHPDWHALVATGERAWTDQYTNILPYLHLERIRR